jgi:RNA polymerase sigma factor (sigma-70 family)
MRCARQHPPTATHCDCRTPSVPLKSKNHPDDVTAWCASWIAKANSMAGRVARVFRDLLLVRGVGIIDAESEAAFLLLDAAMTHNSSGNLTFSAFAFWKIRRGLITYTRSLQRGDNAFVKRGSYKGTDDESIELADICAIDDSFDADLEQREITRELKLAISECLTPQEQVVLAKHYEGGLSIDAIAESADLSYVEVFEIRERAISILRDRLCRRLGIARFTNNDVSWHSPLFGIAVRPEEHLLFEETVKSVLTPTERFCVLAHFKDGMAMRKLRLPLGIGEEAAKKVVEVALGKLRTVVNFETEAERLARTNSGCIHCKNRAQGTNGTRGLCYPCWRKPQIRELYPFRTAWNRAIIEGDEEALSEAAKENREKECTRCKVKKNLLEFSKAKFAPNGRAAACRQCNNLRIREKEAERRAAGGAIISRPSRQRWIKGRGRGSNGS